MKIVYEWRSYKERQQIGSRKLLFLFQAHSIFGIRPEYASAEAFS